MARPAIHAAEVVRSVTDTTTDIVVNHPRNRWWAWALAAVGLLALALIGVASLVPSSLVSDKENKRTGEVEPTPYALTPASADPVNDRIVFGELPDDVERHDPDHNFVFVTVTAPNQSALSWFAGRNDPAVDFLTEEDKFGARTPSQRREFNLQMMRTAEQEAQYVALTKLGFDVEISPGDVIVQDVLCKVASDDDDGECIEWFPSDEQIDPADRIIEADGVRARIGGRPQRGPGRQGAGRRDRPGDRASG